MVREVIILLGLVMEGRSFSLEEKTLAGCVFCLLTLPRGGVRRQIALRRGVRGLQRRQVRRCIFPERFSEQDWLMQKGITAVDVQPLLRKKAGQWVLAERQARGLAGSIAVNADRLTEDVEHAVRFLLGKTGCISFPLIRGAEELQREIRRESGAVLRLFSPLRLSQAETLLDFSASASEGQVLTLRIGESELPRFLLPVEWREEFPSSANTAQLAAVLWELGRLEGDMIGLKSRI